jgi:hypothetical protein
VVEIRFEGFVEEVLGFEVPSLKLAVYLLEILEQVNGVPQGRRSVDALFEPLRFPARVVCRQAETERELVCAAIDEPGRQDYRFEEDFLLR